VKNVAICFPAQRPAPRSVPMYDSDSKE
jgi:hypothetical protein